MSETWVILVDDEVLTGGCAERLTVAGIKNRDDLGEICAQVTEQVRQAYEMSSRDLGAEGTIPLGLKARAIAIALWRFVSEGVPRIEKIQTKEREASAREAREYLDMIARVDIGGTTSPSVGEKWRRFGHCQEDGI